MFMWHRLQNVATHTSRGSDTSVARLLRFPGLLLRWHAVLRIWAEFTCAGLSGGTPGCVSRGALPCSEKNRTVDSDCGWCVLRAPFKRHFLYKLVLVWSPRPPRSSQWRSTQCWPPPWPAATAWAAATAAWTTRAKTSASLQPRPHSSANPSRLLRYRTKTRVNYYTWVFFSGNDSMTDLWWTVFQFDFETSFTSQTCEQKKKNCEEEVFQVHRPLGDFSYYVEQGSDRTPLV